MYDNLHHFRKAAGLRENDASEPSGQPATIMGKPVTPEEKKQREDIATDLLQKLGTEEATMKGHKPGSAGHFEYVKEFIRQKKEKLQHEDMEPGEPAADPNSPQATTTDKEIGEGKGKKKEGEDDKGDGKPPWLQKKIDGDDDDDDGDKDERKKTTEAMIEAAVKGDSPKAIVEKVFRVRG